MLICCLCKRHILAGEKFDSDESVSPMEDWHLDCSNVYKTWDSPVSALDRPPVA